MQQNVMIARLENEAATQQLAMRMAPLLADVTLLTLSGDLGAGKTTFVRALLHAMGYVGRVKSPTYTLIEPYEINGREVFHFDLYRLADPEELEYLGLDDYFHPQALCLVEWPSKAGGLLPIADAQLRLSHDGAARVLELCPRSAAGLALVATLDGP